MNLPTITPVLGYKIAFFVLLIGGSALWLHHSGYESGVADTRAELGKADDANRTANATIENLKMSIATCEIDRLLDRNAQIKALVARDKQQAARAAAAKARDKQRDDAMAGACADWAAQPACGSVQ